MALGQTLEILSPVQLGTGNVILAWGEGVPDGDAEPQLTAAKGSLYIQTNATDDESPFWGKVANGSSNDDWVQLWVNKDESTTGKYLECYLEFTTDAKLRFRSSANYAYSPSAGIVRCAATTGWQFGGGTNYLQLDGTTGALTMAGTTTVTPPSVPLPIATGGGTAASIAAFNAAPSIDLDTDGQTFYASFDVPNNWDADTDLTLVLMVGNEIAETDGDDVSITCQVRGYADGEEMSDAGQAVACLLELTGGTEAINIINRVTGTIDYDEATYPIAAGDTVVIKATVNLGGAGECTGPLHVVAWWVEYTADRLGD